ncbi:protein boule [Trichonephila inaurata madagascariensis]|uniref:Protein boule n=1 Tax=Trichonephila inaurata madagascariensis TaxID=2747483 RepID=A0A8X7BZT6_9ARAC|nr:protein boule [Trichonephila inaurata madagascariensis]
MFSYLINLQIAWSTSSAEGSGSLSPSPVAPNAPKFGTLIPNRIFVGGIAANTTESELHSLFASYGNVKATKIILDRAGVSKGYGFVTFETEEEARRIQKEAEVILKDRKLNIAPAIKKQPFARVYDSPPAIPNGTILYPNGIPTVTYPTNGVTFFNPPENVCTFGNPQANFNVIYPSSVYLPQQTFQCHPISTPYPPVPAVPEMAQFIPAPPHYFIPEHNY